MKILIIGGTRFFGIPMVNQLLKNGHDVTIATRGLTSDSFGKRVSRIQLDVYVPESVRGALIGKHYDVVIDKMGYGSLDIKSILDSVECKKFIHMSTAGVYKLNHFNIMETEYNACNTPIRWCTRGDYDYDTVKRMAEAVLAQNYSDLDWTAVRSPFVLGNDDYTNRLDFYIKHIVNGIPMYVDNLETKMSVSFADDIGKFMAFLVNKEGVGAINYCSKGIVSIEDIIHQIECVAGVKARLSKDGEIAPYNGTQSYSLNIDKAVQLGYKVCEVHEWLDELIEYGVRRLNK